MISDFKKIWFFISEIHILDVKNKMIFCYQKIVFDITNSNSWNQTMIFWYKKMTCIFEIRQIFYWYQELEFFISENVLFFKIKNVIYLYPECDFLISEINFLISRIRILEIRLIFWYQKMSGVFYIRFFIDIRNLNLWKQKMSYFLYQEC